MEFSAKDLEDIQRVAGLLNLTVDELIQQRRRASNLSDQSNTARQIPTEQAASSRDFSTLPPSHGLSELGSSLAWQSAQGSHYHHDESMDVDSFEFEEYIGQPSAASARCHPTSIFLRLGTRRQGKQMSSPPPPYLPQELVDTIIDYLHDERSALSNCSVVCRSWLPTSRLHLFWRISFSVASPNMTPAERCKRLHRLLTSNPEIIPCVRELEVYEGSPGQPTQTPPIRSTTWIATERTFTPLLLMLTHLRRLEFSAQSTLHWGTLPRSLQDGISHVLALPSLAYIRLKSWSFSSFSSFATLFGHCKNLKGLALIACRVSNDPEDAPPVAPVGSLVSDSSDSEGEEGPDGEAFDLIGRRRCRLEFLTLDYVDFSYLGYWLSHQTTVDLTSLRELRFAHFLDFASIQRLLHGTNGSLEHFHLKPGVWDVHPIDFSANTNLRSIKVTLEDPLYALPWAQALLRSITTSNVLERLGLEFYTDLKQMAEGWEELDTLLIKPELSGLRQVDIGLFAAPTNAEFVRVKEALSGPRERGILRVYQLGIKSQRSSRQLMPRISRYEHS